ncbi:MAG: alanine racemase [Alphaproteobacteria bacterium]
MQSNQGLLKIDRAAIRANYAFLRSKIYENIPVAAAVKANAYGLEILEIGPVLWASGTRSFFVATLEEGIALRSILPAAEIHVLSGPVAGMAGLYKKHGLRPVLNTLEDIARARSEKFSGPHAIHFDTGMNRLGLGVQETGTLLENSDMVKDLDIGLVMSHFACADEKDHSLTRGQFESFKKIAAHFPRAKKSLANSSGIFRNADYHFDMVRPGMALYGLNPTPETSNPMQPVVSLEARVLQVKNALKGESVGYAAGHILEKDSSLATIAIGYADGFPRILSNRGVLYWNGTACPILGRVSMDLTVVDLSAIPENKRPRAGGMMEILGPHQSVDDLAHAAGTIGYEILTSLGNRYKRVYTG